MTGRAAAPAAALLAAVLLLSAPMPRAAGQGPAGAPAAVPLPSARQEPVGASTVAGPRAAGQAPAPAPAAAFPRGEVIPRVACIANPRQIYQLYLPSTYDPSRRWPVLYALDARGVASRPMERFRPAAEKYGYVVVSSYNSASDGRMEVNFDAVRALWADTHALLALDDRRVYIAGFSGTVRAACTLAFLAPGTIAGVVGAGAGFPFDRPPDAATGFLFFGTVGTRDFNFHEMLELEEKLHAMGLPHRVEEFEGVHEWMPEALATEAVEWFELRAMADGRRPRDPALVAALLARDLAAAEALEAANRPFHAHHRYRAIAADYASLAEVSEAAVKAASLGVSPAVTAVARERRAAIERDRKVLLRAQRTLAGVRETDDVTLRRIIAALEIPKLKQKAEKRAGTEEGLAAERLLATLAVQTGFYQPRELARQKDWARAAFFLAVAAEIHPKDPYLRYSLAGMKARLGDRRAALEELKRAAALGFPDAGGIEQDPAFEPLRGEPAYREALAVIQKNAAAASVSPARGH